MSLDVDGCRFLIVENEMLLALTLANVVSESGGSVVGPVPSVAKATAFLDAGAVDAALIDFNLVDHTSEDLARRLAESGVPFAFVTGHSRALLPPAMRSYRILEKPCSLEQVKQLLAELCAARAGAGGGEGANPRA